MSLCVSFEVESPEEFAGNVNRMQHYAYFGDLDRDELEHWGIWYIRSRDSGLLQESNADAIEAEMKPFIEAGDVFIQRDNHWAIGWIEGLMIRVYKPGTKDVTDAFNKMNELKEKLDGYPVLDEEDWSRREHESTHENIKECGRRFLNGDEPEDWVHQCWDWFDANDPGAVEAHDDSGGYPSDDQMIACLGELGWLDEYHWPEGYVPPPQRPNWEREPKDLPGQSTLF